MNSVVRRLEGRTRSVSSFEVFGIDTPSRLAKWLSPICQVTFQESLVLLIGEAPTQFGGGGSEDSSSRIWRRPCLISPRKTGNGDESVPENRERRPARRSPALSPGSPLVRCWTPATWRLGGPAAGLLLPTLENPVGRVGPRTIGRHHCASTGIPPPGTMKCHDDRSLRFVIGLLLPRRQVRVALAVRAEIRLVRFHDPAQRQWSPIALREFLEIPRPKYSPRTPATTETVSICPVGTAEDRWPVLPMVPGADDVQ